MKFDINKTTLFINDIKVDKNGWIDFGDYGSSFSELIGDNHKMNKINSPMSTFKQD